MKRIRWVAAFAAAAVLVAISLTACDDTETDPLVMAGPSQYVIQMSVAPNPVRSGDATQLSVTVFRNAAPFTGGTVNLTASDSGVTFGQAQITTDVYGKASTSVTADTTSSAVTLVAEVDGNTGSAILTILRPLITISFSANPDPLTLGGTGIGSIQVLEDGLIPENINITVHITNGYIVNFETPEEQLKGILYENQPNGLVTFGIVILEDVTATFTTFSVTAGGVTQDFIVQIVD